MKEDIQEILESYKLFFTFLIKPKEIIAFVKKRKGLKFALSNILYFGISTGIFAFLISYFNTKEFVITWIPLVIIIQSIIYIPLCLLPLSFRNANTNKKLIFIIKAAIVEATIMEMAEGMDTGDILIQNELEFGRDMHSDELMMAHAGLSVSFLPSAVSDIVEGKIFPVRQDDSKATYSPPLSSEEGHFTWDMSAQMIHNKVRALGSWPSAYTETGDRKLKIYDTRIAYELPPFAELSTAESALSCSIVAAKGADLIVK